MDNGPEFAKTADKTANAPRSLGELSLAPRMSIIEAVAIPGESEPLRLVTQGSFETFQNISDRYGQRTAINAWTNLSVCVAGTRARLRAQKMRPNHSIPDFSAFARVDVSKRHIYGFDPEHFMTLAGAVEVNQRIISTLGTTSANFISDLAQAVHVEVKRTS